MDSESEYNFFKLRKQAKTYISKVFTFSKSNTEQVRNVKMVLEGNEQISLGEVNGSLCLRLSGETRKTQVTAIVSQDSKKIKRLSLLTFKSSNDDFIQSTEKNEFTFRSDEFERLLKFLSQIEFVDLSNKENFQIEDISKSAGPKTIIDSSQRGFIDQIQTMTGQEKDQFFRLLQGTLTVEEINVILGRRQGLEEFESQMAKSKWSEKEWQSFFEREKWVFGYGLDYRIMRQFDREMTVGAGGTDNRDKPVIDFLMNFKEYSVLVEIKKPDTPIFNKRRGGRAGTWEFSAEFMSSVSQIIEQKAEWLSFSQSGSHYTKDGSLPLTTRTKNPKAILVIGSLAQIKMESDVKKQHLMLDTFELFRRESRTIEIITFDELLERARFITNSE